MSRTFVRKHYQVTLPLELRKKLSIEIGDPIEISAGKDGEIIIKPLKAIDASQSWFWSKKHQKAEKEADKELQEGKGKKVNTAKELIDELEK